VTDMLVLSARFSCETVLKATVIRGPFEKFVD
jgi:hypothetical protein